MPSPARLALVAALAIACHGAMAQTTVPATVTVQRIAPQLVAFTGSQVNFQNLVTGLAQGTPVQLFTVMPDGSTQLVTFTPGAALPADQIAQVLETARQRLIGLGIANPTAEQLSVALTGGVVPTAVGGSPVTALVGASAQTAPSPAVQIQSNAAGGGATATTPLSTTPAPAPVNVQLLPGATTTAPRINTSDSLVPAGTTSRSPVPSTPTVTGGATPPAPARGLEAAAPPAPAQGAESAAAQPRVGARVAR
jgi:hypothetical protein